MPKIPNSQKRYILRRARNGRVREKHIAAACYAVDKTLLKRKAREQARKLGFRDMSLSAYINLKLLLP